MRILDGKALSQQMKRKIAERVEAFQSEGKRRPGLAVVIVGDDPGSRSYVAGKAKDCAEVGFAGSTLSYPEDIAEQELLQEVEKLNADPEIDGILIQLPLPKHIDSDRILRAVSPEKDVDGFHPRNVAGLWLKEQCIVPCTPKGVIHILEDNGIEISGKRAVVVGRSNIVGLPVAKLLLDRNATVTIAHSRTPDLGAVTREADILVVAVGRPELVKGDMIKPGAIVIDVGVNRNPATGKLCGDVEFESAKEVAGAITPVPGGVGPLTRACLLENTLECYLRSL
ncbi:MAG: bifunctional methylenetetrahydrofolate dehydrogenase/methenyltetrahydrofolate cyclohydrolase FolD [Muribaculaceae bacterium]|nr:bifunctional methylenetetrahydrofolate dehydrogenase/methenyltetrahydrofolate cyclohydrolase FolD [Muribaculaceae bacterium]